MKRVIVVTKGKRVKSSEKANKGTVYVSTEKRGGKADCRLVNIAQFQNTVSENTEPKNTEP